MPIIRVTKRVTEDAKKAREAALKKDQDFRAYEEELERQEKEAQKIRLAAKEEAKKKVEAKLEEKEEAKKKAEEGSFEATGEVGQVITLPATFGLTPRNSYYYVDVHEHAELWAYGALFYPKSSWVTVRSFDAQHAEDRLLFGSSYAADPALDYTTWLNRVTAPHVVLKYDLSSLGTEKELALIFGFEVWSHEPRLLIYTDDGLLSDETLVPGDNQFLMEIESLNSLKLYFIHARKQDSVLGGTWFFKGISGYVV